MEISLAPFYEETARLQQAVEEAEVALQAARSAASADAANAKRFVAEMINRGRPMECPLEAAAFAIFGPKKEEIKKIIVWSGVLRKNTGNYLIIALGREFQTKHVMVDRPGNHNEFATRYTFLLGKLTGDLLIISIVDEQRSEVTLPIARYVKFEASGEIERTLEPLRLGSNRSLRSAMSMFTSEDLLCDIAGIEKGISTPLKIYIGTVGDHAIGKIRDTLGTLPGILRINDAVVELEKATITEQAQAEGI